MSKPNINVENEQNILVKYELPCVQFPLNSHPPQAFKVEERDLLPVWIPLTSRFFNRRIKIPRERLPPSSCRPEVSCQCRIGRFTVFFSRQSFQHKINQRMIFILLATCTQRRLYTHTCVHVVHTFEHTGDQCEDGRDKTNKKTNED